MGLPGRQVVSNFPIEGEVDATMQAFSQWMAEMKARQNGSLAQTRAEMGIVKNGIAKESSEFVEYKRQSVTAQQQMQSQLTELRENLSKAFGEITTLVKQKTASDQELNSEIQALHSQLASKSAELEALKRSYSSTHQQLQNNLVQTQQQLQFVSGDVTTAKQRAQILQEESVAKMADVEQNVQRLRSLLETSGREGQEQAMRIQEDIGKLHEALTVLSADVFDHKKQTLQVQHKLTSQVSQLEEVRRLRRTMSPDRA